jgi:hypothetical protein
MAMTYDPIFAQDPNNPNTVAKDATITLFDPADPTKAPITITDPTGSPLPNPITVDAFGMGPAFQHPTLERVGWTGAGFTNYLTSYEGMKNVATEAKDAAQEAASAATTAVAEVVTTAAVDGAGKLILTKASGATVDAGNVKGATGATGATGAKGLDGSNVLPTDAAIKQAITTPGTETATVLSATYASQFTATGATTVSELNAWLAVASAIGVKRLIGTVALNAPLVIKSNTTLDASGATITSTHIGNMIQNENCTSATVRDTNITIKGGTWQRNAGNPSGGTGNGWAIAAHSIFLRHVDRLKVADLKVGSTAGKYMVSLGDVTDFHVADILGEAVASDTVHMQGPCSDGVVERVRTRSGGDDIVAFTTTDYSSYDDTHGSFRNVTVRDITAYGATRAVLVCGSANGIEDGFTIKNVVVENVVQLGTGDGVCAAAPFSTITDLAIRNVAGPVSLKNKNMGTVTVENSGPVAVAPDGVGATVTLGRLVIRNPKASSTAALTVNNASVTIGEIIVDGADVTAPSALSLLLGTIGSCTVKRLAFSGSVVPFSIGAAVSRLVIDGYTGTIGAGNSVIRLEATANVGTITVRDAEYTSANTSSGALVEIKSGALVTTLNIHDTKVTAIARLLTIAAGATANVAMALVNVTMAGCNRLMQLNGGTVTMTYSGVAFNTGINQPFGIYGGSALTVKGSGWSGYTAGTVARAAAEVIKVAAQDLPVDLSLLTKADGDRATNTNAALACGVGPAISNGTNWKNLYSGTVY